MRSALLAILLVTLALARAAEAQSSASAEARGSQVPLAWTLTFTVREAYESNIAYGAYLDQGQSTGDYFTRYGASLAHRFPGRRGRFAFALDGGGSLYHQATELNSLTWGVRVDAGYDFTRRLSADVRVGSALGYVREFIRVDPTTTLAPYTLTRYDDGAATLRFLATQGTTVHLDARAQQYGFQNSSPLTNGKNFVVSGGVDHTFATGSRLSGIAEYERTAYGPKFEIERLSGRWKRGVARGWTAEFEGGVAAYRALYVDPTLVLPNQVDPTQPTFGPILRATLDGTRGRNTLTLSASQNVGQTYGFATVGSIRDVSLNYALGLFRNVMLVGSVNANRASDAPIDVPPNGYRVGAGLRWEAIRRLHFILDSYWWDRGGGTTVLASQESWSGWAASISIAYDISWR